jgi:regulatory protein
MKVTKIYAQKKAKGFNVDIDGKYAFSIKDQNTLVDTNLHKDKNLGKQDIIEIIKIDIENVFISKCIDLISRRLRSEKEIHDYIFKKIYKYFKNIEVIDIPEKELKSIIANNIIEKLKQKKYVNDEDFAQFWIQNRLRKNKGQHKIRAELLQKGVNNEIIKKKLTNIPQEDMQDSIQKAIDKKEKRLKTDDKFKRYQKMYNYLARKGFDNSLIKDNLRKRGFSM